MDASYEGEETFSLVESVRKTAEDFYPGSWYLAGEGISTYDLMDTVTADMLKVNLIAIAAVFLVLLFTMKSISLPIILVLSIETAIWINMSCPYFMNQRIFYIAYLIISSIQLGATVDYAILMTDRYKENGKHGKEGGIVSNHFRMLRYDYHFRIFVLNCSRITTWIYFDESAFSPAGNLYWKRGDFFFAYCVVRFSGAAISM